MAKIRGCFVDALIVAMGFMAVCILCTACAPQGQLTGPSQCGTVITIPIEMQERMADEIARLGPDDPLVVSNRLFGNMRDEARSCQAAEMGK